MDNNHSNRSQISDKRLGFYYAGMALLAVGLLTFFSFFISIAMMIGQPRFDNDGFGSIVIRPILGMGMMMLGNFLMRVGSRGLAGAGVILDPKQARKDLEPWSHMAGGIAKDALKEADIQLGGTNADTEMPFDEKLRRLEKLRTDGLLTEAEYQQKRNDMLKEKW